MVDLRRAGVDDLDALVPLFDAYRQSYRLKSDAAGARRFLRERLEADQSIVLLAFVDGVGIPVKLNAYSGRNPNGIPG